MFSAQNDKRRGSTWAHRVTWVTAALPQDGVVIAIHDCSDRKYVMIFGDAFSVVWLEGCLRSVVFGWGFLVKESD